MKYAHIIETKIQGWYDDSIHQEIPTPNIEVTEEIWQEAININANCYEDGKFIVKDLRTNEELEAQRIPAIKSKAGEIILSRYPEFKQRNAQLGVYGSEYLNTMRAFIEDIILQSNDLEVSGTADDFVISETTLGE